jgi:6-phosphogluconate dehydrogenase
MTLGFIGLGKMGAQMVERLHDAGHTVIVSDVNEDAVTAAVASGGIAATNLADLASKLPGKAVVWLMIPQQFVDRTLGELINVLPAGSVVIDGGNSDFRDTLTRAKLAAEHGIILMDVGTSGGILGRENGFSMMVGGNADVYPVIEPIIQSLSQTGGYDYFGPAGSGHYVKMVHNAIEYGMMEAYAEGYHLLKAGPIREIDLAKVSRVWQHGSIIASQLNALNVKIFQDNPNLEGATGYVADSGEARWSIEVAESRNIPVPVIATSLEVRRASQTGTVNFATKLLAEMRNSFGGHALNKQK